MKVAQKALIDETSTAPWLGRPNTPVKSDIISAEETADDTISDQVLSTKTIYGVGLVLKHGSASASNRSFQRTGTKFHSQSSLVAPKRQRLQEYAIYDRLIEFADIANPGNCFAVIYRDQSLAKIQLKYLTAMSVLGSPVYIGSPKRSPVRLKNGMPVVETDFPIVPMNIEHKDFVVKKHLPRVDLVIPSTPGDMKYFIRHNEPVNLSRFRYDVLTASCRGRMCDRASSNMDRNIACGCILASFDGPVASVAVISIGINVPKEVNVRGMQDIEDFRSHRLTTFLIKEQTKYAQLEEKEMMERTLEDTDQIRKMFAYVNEKGGWTIAGWFRRGEIQDVSTEGTYVMNEATTLHLSLLIPTKDTIRKLEDEEFNKLRLTV